MKPLYRHVCCLTISLSAGIFAQEAVNRLSDSSASATETVQHDLGTRATAESYYLAHTPSGIQPASIDETMPERTPQLVMATAGTAEMANAETIAQPNYPRANGLPAFDQIATDETPATVDPTQPSLNQVVDPADTETLVSTSPTSVVDVSTAWNPPPTIAAPAQGGNHPPQQAPSLPTAPRHEVVTQLPPPTSVSEPSSGGPLPAPGGHPNDYPISPSPTYHSHQRSTAAELVQQNAAIRAAQRAGRIEARKWAGFSPLRPPAQPIPFMSAPDRRQPAVIIVPFADRRYRTTQR